jgi:type II secretion system protein C
MRSFFRNKQNTLLTLLVIAVAVYLVVDIAYRVVEMNAPPPEPQQQAAAGPPAADTAKDPLEAYGVIVERNLFRTTDKPLVVDQSDPNSLEATSLQLDLYGTIAGEGGKGYAIIEERDKKRQRLYKVGDSVAGATIIRIARNAVVLRVGDREQVLKKKETAMRGGSRTPAAFPAVPSGPAPGSAPAPRPSARPSTGGPAGAAGDLASLLTQARVTPNVTAGSPGKADGVIINEIQAGSLFETVGLVNGDIIQEVNGRTVTGVADLVSMYRDLKPGTSLAVKVTRSGRQVILNHVVE